MKPIGTIKEFKKYKKFIKLNINTTHIIFSNEFNQKIKLSDDITHVSFRQKT